MSVYPSTRRLDSEMVELGEISRHRLKDQTLSTQIKESCCFKTCVFRVWQILLIVFIVALLCLLNAMFGPGNTDLKYSAVEQNRRTETGGCEKISTKTPTEPSARTKDRETTASGKETTQVTTTEQQPSPNPTTAPQTTVKQTTPATIPQTTGQTSAGPLTVPPASANPPLTTAEQTTASPTTTGPAPTTTAPSLECGVAIVGGGKNCTRWF
ncbi:hypothetical protein OS493_019033 [Desmophyllum pertusum]|uniref:Uncharacterized protein n=1 Tax=Desmophyllum pertusum TaxID=174260 RepID=A0A9X0CT48_9CNID|nr:hypothetical protein OS493_019033 [Desmophyllum pertusum]